MEAHPLVEEKKKFVDVGPCYYQEASQLRNTREFDITGRSMKGWVVVQAEGYESDQALKELAEQGIEIALTLPPK